MTVDRPNFDRMAANVPPTGARIHGRTGRMGLGFAAVVLGLAALSACSTGSTSGSTSGSGDTASATSPASSNVAQNTAFDQCMTANGVTKPSAPQDGGAPPSGAARPPASKQGKQGRTPQTPPGVDATVWQKALVACRSVTGAPPAN